MGKMVEIGNGIKVNASAVSYIEDNVVVLSNKHRYTAGENALKIIKTELVASKLKRAEILELACKIFADGFVGNKTFEAEGSSVTYNTDAVEQGDIYCASFYDGGFYVGARESEDYEPKVGDWWCFSLLPITATFPTKSSLADRYVQTIANATVKNYSLGLYYNLAIFATGKGLLKAGVEDASHFEIDYRYVGGGQSINGVFADTTGQSTSTLVQIYNGGNLDLEKGDNINLQWFKPVTSSDILAYQATGHMGALFLNDTAEYEGEGGLKTGTAFFAISSSNYTVRKKIKVLHGLTSNDKSKFVYRAKSAYFRKSGETQITISQDFIKKIDDFNILVDFVSASDYYGVSFDDGWYGTIGLVFDASVFDEGIPEHTSYVYEVLKDNTETATVTTLSMEGDE